MLELQVGQSVDLRPESGDTLDALWSRVRRQATRYGATNRYYHLHKRSGSISVQRVNRGGGRKLAPFLRMTPGERLPCKDPFETEKQKRNLRRRLLYLSDLGKIIWVERHADGELYYRCSGCLDTARFWSENPIDDGFTITDAKVVCGPDYLSALQREFAGIKSKIFARRAAAAAASAAAAADV